MVVRVESSCMVVKMTFPPPSELVSLLPFTRKKRGPEFFFFLRVRCDVPLGLLYPAVIITGIGHLNRTLKEVFRRGSSEKVI